MSLLYIPTILNETYIWILRNPILIQYLHIIFVSFIRFYSFPLLWFKKTYSLPQEFHSIFAFILQRKFETEIKLCQLLGGVLPKYYLTPKKIWLITFISLMSQHFPDRLNEYVTLSWLDKLAAQFISKQCFQYKTQLQLQLLV